MPINAILDINTTYIVSCGICAFIGYLYGRLKDVIEMKSLAKTFQSGINSGKLKFPMNPLPPANILPIPIREPQTISYIG